MALMAAGFITYLSPCSEDVRQNTLASWWQQLDEVELRLSVKDGVSKAVHFDFLRFLVPEKDRLHWKAQGLPSDSLSVENAVVMLQVPSLCLSSEIFHNNLAKMRLPLKYLISLCLLRFGFQFTRPFV